MNTALVHVAERPALDPLAFVRALFRDLPAGAVAWGARVPGDPLAAERRHWFGFPITRGARLGPLSSLAGGDASPTSPRCTQ